MSLLKTKVKASQTVSGGGYFRGFLAATVVSSVSFIAISTAFPSGSTQFITQPTSARPMQTAAIVEPAANRLVPLDGTNQTATLGIQPPSFGGPATESNSGLGPVATNMSAPTLSSGQPAGLNVSTEGTEVAVANTEAMERPTAGLDVQTASIAVPITESSTGAVVEPAVNVAAVATTELPPIPKALETGMFAQNAQQFTDSGTRPLMSLILKVNDIEEVKAAFGLAASVTIAIDADNPNALELAAAYRMVGGESVLLLSDGTLALDATPAVAKSAFDALLPSELQVVGVLDVSGTAIPDSTLSVDAAMRTLSPLGAAVITVPGHSAINVAQSANIPTIDILDVIEGADTAAVIADINRNLPVMTGRGASVLYGTADNVTISALYSWLASSSATSFIMAPVSAAIAR